MTLSTLIYLLAAVIAAPVIVAAARAAARRRPHRVHPLAIELARLVDPFDHGIHARIVASGHPTNEVATPASTDAKLKTQLKGIEEQLSDARDRRAVALKDRDRAKAAFVSSGTAGESSPQFKAAKEAVARVGKIEDEIAALTSQQVAALKLLGGARSNGADRLNAPPWPESLGWDSSPLVASDFTRQSLQEVAFSSQPTGRTALGEVASRDAFAASFGQPMAADVTGTTAMRRGEWAGVVSQLRRRLRVLDLIPMGTMDGNTFPYTRESGSLTTAAETAEGSAKPEAGITLTDVEATAKTIAHWLKVRKQSLDDVPALRSIIDGRLRYGLELRLENQVLAGDGTGENLTGILGTSGTGLVEYDADELVADQILAGIVAVFLANAEASGVVMNPLDWQAAIKAKASGDGHYYSEGPFSTTPQIMWGVPAIPSAAIPQGTALVGDFALGAQILIRQGVQVLLSDSDQDDFIKNKVTLLAELRAALAVWQATCFAVVELADPAA